MLPKVQFYKNSFPVGSYTGKSAFRVEITVLTLSPAERNMNVQGVKQLLFQSLLSFPADFYLSIPAGHL